MSKTDDRRLMERHAAARLCNAFRDYNQRFRDVTRNAAHHFAARDWAAGRLDAVRRIELYNDSVTAATEDMRAALGHRISSRDSWTEIKRRYAELISDRPDSEFYKTFFSSVTRRNFDTLGVDPAVEFLAADVEPAAADAYPLQTRIYRNRGSLFHLFDEILGDLPFSHAFRDVESTISFITAEIGAYRREQRIASFPREVEFIPPLFYRGRRAYLVGRVLGNGWHVPLVIPFANPHEGVVTDAVILSESEVSMLFGFTRSYFHVDLEVVGSAVRFLRELMPRKPVEEIYTVLGRAKQGKTERYRSLMRHMQNSSDLFVVAPGAAGMVMQVFTLPSFYVVFKVIRDKFAYPKNIRPEQVREKYELVFKHDRAGRLVDAQEYRRLSFDLERFEPALRDALLGDCSHNCTVQGEQLVIEHLYIERRLIPLNLFLLDAPAEQAALAVIDYGQAVRDLASSNIFAGDLLMKNFGVTRHGRVIFYDYDEVTFVTDCNFRPLPDSGRLEDEMSAEPWFFVAPNDVFPEEFIKFFGFNPELQQVFRKYHSELLSFKWWSRTKQR
ncbi:MAG TPA: bifunctional isocitrate dehydrogenase kinase/phosphatase, partial [Woeseiaceae bacterium]|nr:bifunctional isocitrate dehydrogenase kinase/phosphatase [Woeseiaceae bacterium]